MSAKNLCFIPYLNYPDWDIQTAYNLALFASLAYADQEDRKSLNLTSVKSFEFAVHDGVTNIFNKLANHKRIKMFHKVRANLIVEEVEKHHAFDQENLSCFEQLGVKLYIASNQKTTLIFIQGTENILNFFADMTRILIPKDKELTISKFLKETISNSDSFMELLAKNFAIKYETTSFLEHKKAIANYLLAKRNAEAHIGFMSIIASFLFDPNFLHALAIHKINHKQVFICGHSLGGALALLLARELQASCSQAICCYTYGCPRLGSKTFIETIDPAIRHYRVINENDPIAWLYNAKEAPDLWCDHGAIRHLYKDQNGETKLKLNASHEKDWASDHFIKSYIDNLTILCRAQKKEIAQTQKQLESTPHI